MSQDRLVETDTQKPDAGLMNNGVSEAGAPFPLPRCHHHPQFPKKRGLWGPHPHDGGALLSAVGEGELCPGQVSALPLAEQPGTRSWGSLAGGTPLPTGFPPGPRSPGNLQPRGPIWHLRDQGRRLRAWAGQPGLGLFCQLLSSLLTASPAPPSPPGPAPHPCPLGPGRWVPGRGLCWAEGRGQRTCPQARPSSPESRLAGARRRGERQRLWS